MWEVEAKSDVHVVCCQFDEGETNKRFFDIAASEDLNFVVGLSQGDCSK